MLIPLLIVILVCGVLVWGIRAMPGIDETFKQFAVVAIIVCMAIWIILRILGPAAETMHLP